MQFSYLALAGLAITNGVAGYTLNEADNYTPSKFKDMFDFITGDDPTHGTVNFVSADAATKAGYYSTTGSSVYMGVDMKNKATGRGRDSIRIESKRLYNVGSLIIVDIAHMPVGCGTWPAFWTYGANWPYQGEIDILEGVHNQADDQMTLHTGPGCTIQSSGFTGGLLTGNCDVNAAGQDANVGCGIKANKANSYGTGFNNIKGGIFATQFNSDQISIWFFPRGAIPADITNGAPNPSAWGTPTAKFKGSCNIPNMFKDHKITFDNTFCGDWAGNVWASSGCAASTGVSTCDAFVRNNPDKFKEAYWTVNSLKVYKNTNTKREEEAVSRVSRVFKA